MRTPPQLFLSFISISSLILGVFAVLIMRKLEDSPETSSAKIKLSPEQTQSDFQLLAVTNLFVAIALLIYGIGGIMASENLVRIAEWSITGFALAPVYAFLKLWRRI